MRGCYTDLRCGMWNSRDWSIALLDVIEGGDSGLGTGVVEQCTAFRNNERKGSSRS